MSLSRDYLTNIELLDALECAALELERRGDDETFFPPARYQAASEAVQHTNKNTAAVKLSLATADLALLNGQPLL